MLDNLVMPGSALDWSLILTYLRIQACILVMPGFGERVVPARVKVAVAMALTPILAEFSHGMDGEARLEGPMLVFGGVITEVAIGFAIGTLVRVIAFAINIAATAIASTASLSQIIGAPNEASPHPIGNLFHLGGTALLLAMGLPVMLIRLLADSLDLWPVGGLPEIAGLVGEVVGIVAASFQLAMVLSAPFILGGFLFQALSGVISRVMPALPVVFIGAPAAIMLALMALVLLSPMILSVWLDAVLSFQLSVRP
ncbi:flagellar biosynthetic protein FliR [Paracoccus sp. M683]|uniref:flagellar biosynthetic protein FliR n=1 Tax=Paracoccus sp. M683 TaxID=2594268 RepID=UPI001180347E|nr:flagellar biosynthetic protein FliR [Paracoccus sp. M683]TRW95508.1 flagellar biosynthetic protein FliR [Paracoccus sp. M683]